MTNAATTPDSNVSSMHIKVFSPFKVFLDSTGTSVSASNETGPFDILPHHHNFITLIDACDLIVRPVGQGKPKIIRISGGIMYVKENDVTVFLDV